MNNEKTIQQILESARQEISRTTTIPADKIHVHVSFDPIGHATPQMSSEQLRSLIRDVVRLMPSEIKAKDIRQALKARGYHGKLSRKEMQFARDEHERQILKGGNDD